MDTLSQQAKKIATNYLKQVRPRLKVNKALLFGSAARGTMTRHSDIDLIILSNEFKSMDLQKRLILLSRLRGQKFLSWPMDILGYTPQEFQKLSRISSMFAEAKLQGVEIK